MTRDHHGDRIERRAEKPHRIHPGLAIDDIRAIVRLPEAEARRREAGGAKIAVMKGHHRDQRANAAVGELDAHRFEARIEMAREGRGSTAYVTIAKCSKVVTTSMPP